MMKILLEHLSQRFLNNLVLDDTSSNSTVSAVAGVINAVVVDDTTHRTTLVDWCTAASGAGLGDQIGIRRAVLAVLAKDKDPITTVLEKSLAQFGDQLYIKHAAILQQEGRPNIRLETRKLDSKANALCSPHSDTAA